LACPECGFSLPELSPRMFSFNSPYGACPVCDGIGSQMEVDVDLVIPDPSLTLAEGAIAPWTGSTSNYYPQLLAAACAHFGIDMHVPVQHLPEEQLHLLLYGRPEEMIQFQYENDFGMRRQARIPFEGVIPNLTRRYRETTSDVIREQIEGYMSVRPCPACQGKRLKPEVLAVQVGGRNIAWVTDLTVHEALAFFNQLELTE